MFPLSTGQVYLAEKAVHTNEGCQFKTLWAVGKDAENLEVAQEIIFDWHSTKEGRKQHAMEKATEYLAQRDFAGDPARQ